MNRRPRHQDRLSLWPPGRSTGGSHANLSSGAMLFATLAFLPVIALMIVPVGERRQAYAVVLVTGSTLFGSVGVILAVTALARRQAGLAIAAASVVLNLAAIAAAIWWFADAIIKR